MALARLWLPLFMHTPFAFELVPAASSFIRDLDDAATLHQHGARESSSRLLIFCIAATVLWCECYSSFVVLRLPCAFSL